MGSQDTHRDEPLPEMKLPVIKLTSASKSEAGMKADQATELAIS